ncbi:MAG: salicylate synthase [Desulfobacter sp.]
MTPHRCFSDDLADKYQSLGYWESLTLGEHLDNWSRKYQQKTALVEGKTRFTYGHLSQKVNELAAGFLNLGIRKQDHVVIQLPNSISFVTACFALFKIGAVPIMAMPPHREAELDGIFELAQPTAYIIPETYLGFNYEEMAKGLLERHPCVKHLIIDSAGQDLFNRNSLAPTLVDIDPPSPTDTALLLLSGGTTGTPKLIPRTHADYAYNARASALKCGMNEDSVYLAVLPVAHNFPLACPGIIGTLFSGGTIVLSRTTSPDEALPLIEKERVTITALVPAMVNLWLQVMAWEETDLTSLQLLQVGGSPLDDTLARQIMPAMGCTLQQVFGMAEGLLCYTDPKDPEDIILSCQGKPLSPHDDIRILDDDGKEVPPGETGELLVRGPYTIHGYYRAPEQNRKDFTPDGFYRSGDAVMMTRDGNIVVKGRIKEQINRAGEKIVASEIESCLNTYPGISNCALIGVPDDTLGERSCAFVIPAGAPVSLPEVHDHLETLGIARYKMPDQLETIDALPLTSVGKIDKKKLLHLVDGEKQKTLPEARLALKTDPLSFACRLIEALSPDTYLLYENQGEWSLGIGVDALITVDSQHIRVTREGNTQVFKNNGLAQTMEQALASLPYSGWRAYGTADFELSYLNFGLEIPQRNSTLLTLFVPKAELRLDSKSALVRAVNRAELEHLSAELKALSADKEAASLLRRAASKSTDIPEINTHRCGIYKKIVACAVAEIEAPEYQKVILSRKVPLERKVDMTASFIAGRQANTPARSFILKMEDFSAAGFSPETVVEVSADGIVSTQPLAGTRSTGSGVEEEIQLKEDLLTDSKEIAEHAISIKLAYEEMQQVCDPDAIFLGDFMTIARRGTVQHLASRLKGRLKKGCNSWDAFTALFPAVTASGIPKRESIRAIGRHEEEPRGLYSGCVMTIDQDGTMDAALVLRSFFQNSETAWLRAGAGIVNLSTPERELEETCEKLRSVSRQIVYI